MQFSVTILGSNSALPISNRYPTAQVLNASGRLFLIDCGEGTQLQLRRNKIKFSKIDSIFISHLHGDHCFGLIGLISTFGLLGRKKDLNIYAHKDLERLLKPWLEFFAVDLSYSIVFNNIDTSISDVIYEDDKITVTTIPLKHRIPTTGFLFKEKRRELNIKRDAIDYYKIPIKWIHRIKKGEDYYTEDGVKIENHILTQNPKKCRSYAFCSDTKFNKDIIPIIKNADLLYHEATFANDNAKMAKKTYHSTAEEAAIIAKEANVDKLIIGHFSSRYKELDVFLEESKAIFENTELAIEGKIFNILQKEEEKE